MDLPEKTLSYIAGFFDGEGTINISPGRGSNYYTLSISVTNTDHEILFQLKEWLGGKVSNAKVRNARSKPVRRWSVDSGQAEEILEALLPYLIVKKRRAHLAIGFRELFKGEFILPRGNAKGPEHEQKKQRILAQREQFYLELRRQNRRGS